MIHDGYIQCCGDLTEYVTTFAPQSNRQLGASQSRVGFWCNSSGLSGLSLDQVLTRGNIRLQCEACASEFMSHGTGKDSDLK